VTCADASARLLGVPAAQMGAVNQPDPVKVEPVKVAPDEDVKIEEDEDLV
jgi:hypothetical protein